MKIKLPLLSGVIGGVLLMGGILYSCSKANEVDLRKQAGITDACDTVAMTYKTNILPILKSNCYNCHSAGSYKSSGSGLNFEDFSVLKTAIASGNLLNAIQHMGSVTPMPLNLPALSNCDINKIKDWINTGALNN